MAESKIDEIIRLRKAPGCKTSDGPGSMRHEMVFDRPNPAKDIPETLRRLENDGYFRKHPEALPSAMSKFEESKQMPESKVDYQKEGHPFDTSG